MYLFSYNTGSRALTDIHTVLVWYVVYEKHLSREIVPNTSCHTHFLLHNFEMQKG